MKFLLFFLIVLCWQVTTAKKIKCFDVSEGSTTVTKTTTKCPRATCRNLYIWSEELCKCICPRIRCPPGTILGKDCDCIPTTTPDTTLCPRQECRNRYVWVQEWCECVCPPMYCPEGTIHGSDCDCIPESTYETTPELCEPVVPCNRSWFWNYETCACQLGCDYIRIDCRQGTKWDIFACDCIDACPGVFCDENMVADSETCICVPIDVTETSPETTSSVCNGMVCEYGYHLDPTNCWCAPNDCPEYCSMLYDSSGKPYCQCGWGCDYIRLDCPEGTKWDLGVCDCIFDPDYTSTPSPCPPCDGENVLNPETCACECPWTEADCSGPLAEFDPFMCTCRRHPCDPPYPCPEGEMISWEVCNCVPDPDYTTPCPPCAGNNELNTTTCECVCQKTEDDCPGPRSELRLDICECVMRPCDPPLPCPKGQVVDWEICGCVKDPNATKPTDKPKGSDSSESSEDSSSKSDKSKESSDKQKPIKGKNPSGDEKPKNP